MTIQPVQLRPLNILDPMREGQRIRAMRTENERVATADELLNTLSQSQSPQLEPEFQRLLAVDPARAKQLIDVTGAQDEMRLNAMLTDAKVSRQLLAQDNLQGAAQVLQNRLQLLGDRDNTQTAEVFRDIINGRPDEAIDKLDTFLRAFDPTAGTPQAQVGRFKTVKTNRGFDIVDSATGNVVLSKEAPRTEEERQKLRKLKSDAEKSETEAQLKARTAETEEEKRNSALEMASETASIARRLLESPNLDDIVGTLQPSLPTFRGSSQDLINDALRLESMLTVDNLKLMTGVLTDRDIKFLTRVGSGLNIEDGGIRGSEAGVRKRLTEIIEKLEGVTLPDSPQAPVSGFKVLSIE